LKKAQNLGERRIIEIIQRRLDLMPKIAVPFGDDVSAFETEKGKLVVLKTDMLVDKTDAPPGMNLWQTARKAVVMNVSDFAAKGVKPAAVLIALGLPRNITKKDVEEIGSGLNAGAHEYGTYIIGGDTGEASDLIIAVSLFGLAAKDALMLRSGAKPGDVIAVTGLFGKTSAGLRILVNDLKAPKKIRKTLIDSVLMPTARLKEGLALVETGAVNASIDSSDGLAWSLHEIARSSRVGISIDLLPTAEQCSTFAVANKLDSAELTLYGGEEYELVLTVKPRMWKKAQEAVENVGGSLFKIGKVTSEKSVVLATDGKRISIEARGYEHFKSR
jgi:thiamine-monophosphate kinase